jgi:AraC family transcriptional regulator of arabinose operon
MSSAAQIQPTIPLMAVDLGVRWPHGPGYTVERPYGLGMYLFLCFHSPMDVRTAEGVVAAEPGDCLLYAPSFPQWYRGRDAGFIDDWLHVDGPAMPEVVRVYQIPVNVIMRPRGTEFVTPIFEAINREMRRREPLWRESVCLMVQSLFLHLGRQLVRQTPAELTPAEATRVDEFRNLRMHVHERMQESWRVAEMAELAHLSPSRFAVLYTKLFGVSPMEDLIHARLHRARALLTDGGISVSDAADRAGFGSVCHFSRLFRKHVGCPPRDYYRRLLTGEAPMPDTQGDGTGPPVSLQHSSVTQGWILLTANRGVPLDADGARGSMGARTQPARRDEPQGVQAR